MSKARVIIYMEGGLIQEILSCDQALEVIVHDDASDVGTFDDKIIQVDGEPVYLSLWNVEPDPESIPKYFKLEAAIEQDDQDTDTAEETEGEIETFTCSTCNQEVNNLCDACGVCGNCCECSVVLLISGYEWTCPICNEHNYTAVAVEEVTCQACGKIYHVDMTVMPRINRESLE